MFQALAMMDDFVLFDSFRSNVTLLCLSHSFSFEHQHSLVQVRRSHRITLIHTNHQRILTRYIYLPPKVFSIAFFPINIASSSLLMLYMPKPALYQRIILARHNAYLHHVYILSIQENKKDIRHGQGTTSTAN